MNRGFGRTSPTRRNLLQWLLGALAFRYIPIAEAASPRLDRVRAGLGDFRRTGRSLRRYSVTARITAFGIPIFTRDGVGGGYAIVETGQAGDAQALALQFNAGSWPERCAGLNRFGVMHEAVVTRGSSVPSEAATVELDFAGLITSTKEESLDDARAALNESGEKASVTVAWGGVSQGRAWSESGPMLVDKGCTWEDAESALNRLAGGFQGNTKREARVSGAVSFLAVMRDAARSGESKSRRQFLHNGKLYWVETEWKGRATGAERKLEGTLRNEQGEKTAHFTNHYAAGDDSGIPIRIEYKAKSYLKLVFEASQAADRDGARVPLPSLFTGA